MSWNSYNADGQVLQGVLAGATLTTPVIAEIDSGSTITLDATTDIVLDADGGDVCFKDGGSTFGSATTTSGNLIIKSGTTTALTFSGANVTVAGTIGSGAITSTAGITGTQVDILAQGDLRLQDNTGGQYIALDSPATVATSYTITLPAAQPAAGNALKVASISSNVAVAEWGTAGVGLGMVIALGG